MLRFRVKLATSSQPSPKCPNSVKVGKGWTQSIHTSGLVHGLIGSVTYAFTAGHIVSILRDLHRSSPFRKVEMPKGNGHERYFAYIECRDHSV